MAKEQWDIYFDAVRKQNWKTAKDFLTQISKEDRNNSQTFLKLGDICQRTGDKSEAIAAYTHAAQLLRMQGFAQKALATYKIALRLDPTNPEIIKRAEILIDEFEASKTAPHIKIPAAAEAAAEISSPPEVSEKPVLDIPESTEWLERTSFAPEMPDKTISVPEILPSDMSALFESTSLTTETADIPQSSEKDQIRQLDIGLSSEAEVPDIKRPEEPESAASGTAPEQQEEDADWLESAYDAVDTKIFKSDSDRSSVSDGSDTSAINLVYREKPVEQEEDVSADISNFLTPLSERFAMKTPEIFHDLPEDMVTNFINELTMRKYKDKQHVIEEGDAGDSMYIIHSGKAKVVAHLLGRELELAILDEGDVFGEVGFLTGRPRTAAVIADGPLEVYEVSRLDIEKLIEVSPEIMGKIEDFYELRVRDTINKIKN